MAAKTATLPAALQDQWDRLDRFDQLQLLAVLAECQDCGSLSEAGRRLFNRSREERKVVNDADRLRKYLLRFGVSWDDLQVLR